MQKTNLNILFFATPILILAGLLYGCSSEKKELPNIIFIMSDDHAAHAIGAYGSIYKDYFSTPNIDRIANEGIKFNNVFCTNAICGPSRATILTGKYSHLNGYYKNESGGKFNPDQWTFPKAFQDSGYETSLFGKWHLGSKPAGFDFFKYHDNASQQGFYYDPVYNENGIQVKEKGYATNLTTDFALDWLNSQRDSEKPFMMMLQFKAPHRDWRPEEKYKDLFKGVEMPYPSTFYDDYSTREKTAGDTDMTMDFLNREDMKLIPPDSLTDKELNTWYNWGNRRGFGEGWLPHDSMTIKEARKWKYQRFIKDYLACIKSVDDNIGRVLDYLDQHDLTENTIVVYTSDQGFYLGDHGWFDKRFMYEQSLRMPFLLRYPKLEASSSINDDVITNLDFAPTLLDFADINIPKEVQGRSFTSNLRGDKPEDWPKYMYYHYYEFPFWHHVQPHYGIRGERYKLIHFYYNIDQWEFYDLQKDPNELNNAIDNPEYSEVIASMKKKIAEKQKLYKDTGSLKDYRRITDTDFGNKSGE